MDGPFSHLPSTSRICTDDIASQPAFISLRPCAVEFGAQSAPPGTQGPRAAGAPQGGRGRCRRRGQGQHRPRGRRRPQEARPQAQECGAACRGGGMSSLPPATLRPTVKLLRNLVLTCTRACGGSLRYCAALQECLSCGKISTSATAKNSLTDGVWNL